MTNAELVPMYERRLVQAEANLAYWINEHAAFLDGQSMAEWTLAKGAVDGIKNRLGLLNGIVEAK